ncbi:glutamate--tRNA ligase [Paenibacillus sp. FSL H8-0122]|uniref:glutamate--tRNA ligase n=1 Tax=Paenibacillus sp. FSL H8-0122 TaxID=2954510 RepID=UPI0030FBE147
MSRTIAELLFGGKEEQETDYDQVYPPRALKAGALVSRFGPSPTGFLHIGGVFAALISQRLAQQTEGCFYLRIEDTDKRREVEGGVSSLIQALTHYGIHFDEGPIGLSKEIGRYGPYIQSQRAHIYRAMVRKLMEEGKAYPCFVSEEEIQEIRKSQEAKKVQTGYYGEWAVHRDLSFSEVADYLKEGRPYVIRLKANPLKPKLVFHDLIRGEVELPTNYQDIVLLKSGGLPTYHLAHVVDDHWMRTTHVIRGDEWLSSIPVHIQLFEYFGWTPPCYAHISPIMKEEGNSKRKLSKRKDPEAAVQYYQEKGVPEKSVIEYLLTLANSNYEQWRNEHAGANNKAFNVELHRMNSSGALFDLKKLMNISKDVIAGMKAEEVYQEAVAWAKTYDPPLAELLTEKKEYGLKIISIGRSGEKPRKDISQWSEIREIYGYFFDELFQKPDVKQDYPKNISAEDIAAITQKYIARFKDNEKNYSNEEWFEEIKEIAREIGFAPEMKLFKANKTLYRGHVGDISMVLRIAITGRGNTPDLYEVIQVLGHSKVRSRLKI